jgi:diguanylate cyclase (GGDEF)-like protein
MAVTALVGALSLLTGIAAGLAVARILARRRRSARAGVHRQAAESFPGGALLVFDRRLRHAAASGQGLSELASGRIEGKTVREAFPVDVWTVLEPAYRAALEGQESSFELPHGNRDHLHRVTPIRDRSGAVVGGLVVAQDITDRKREEHRLRQWASRDGLTGLWNRERLVHELDWILKDGGRRDDGKATLLYIDLDGFKAVNDTLGHAAGDELLRRVAREIEARTRHTDAVARLGGDEFAVLLPGTTLEQAERVAEKITRAIESVWPDRRRGGASVGIAELRRDGRTATDVLSAADRAMYADKRSRAIRRAS